MVKIKKSSIQKKTHIKKVVTKPKKVKNVDEKLLKNIQAKKPETSILEERYKIHVTDVENAIKGVVQLHTNNNKIKNQLFDEDKFPINLQLSCHQIPRGNPKILRVPLTHSLLTPEDEVCLIVSEVKGIGNKEHEKHVDYYNELLAKKNVTNIKKIMTVHEFNTEHETFEQKARLVDLYDAFLVCGKVGGRVVKKCGKKFYQKRKVPTHVNLKATKLKEHIDKSLSKSFLHLHLKGDSYNVQLGHSKMSVADMIDNFISTVKYLDENFPGGFENVKGLHVYTPRATSIPVYVSAKNPKDLPKFKVKVTNGFVAKAIQDELTTLPNAQVLVKPDGRVIVKRTHVEDEDADKITLQDIIDDNKSSKNKETGNEKESRKILKSNKKVKNSTKNIQSDWEEVALDQTNVSVEPLHKKKKQKNVELDAISRKKNKVTSSKSKKKLKVAKV